MARSTPEDASRTELDSTDNELSETARDEDEVSPIQIDEERTAKPYIGLIFIGIIILLLISTLLAGHLLF